jgi:MULE transposase domain
MTLPKPTSLPNLTISPVSPVLTPPKCSTSTDGFGNVLQITTPTSSSPLFISNTKQFPNNKSPIDLLHLVDSPFDSSNNAVRRSNRLISPSNPLFNRVFLDDPTRSPPLSIDNTILPKLIGNQYLHTALIDYLIQRSITTTDKEDTIIASSLSLSLMQSFLRNNEENNASIGQRGQTILRNMYHYYSTKEFRFFSMVCTKHHFFFVSLNFNACDPNKPIFSDVNVYDSMKHVLRERSKKTISFAPGSMAATYLLTLQKFLSTFSFFNSPKNHVLLNDKHYIIKEAKFIACPQQSNGFDCSLFALGTLIHAVDGLPIDNTIFHQDDITLFRKELYNILSINDTITATLNPMTSLSREFIISFFPILYIRYNDNGPGNIEDDPFIKGMRKTANDVSNNNNASASITDDAKPVTDNNEQKPTHVEYYDTLFHNMFFKTKPLFMDLEQVTQKIAEFEKDNDMRLTIKHSVPKRSFREYICNSHVDCPFFCRFGPSERESTQIKAKRCNLNHKGLVKSKVSVDGKRKLKKRIKGFLKDTLDKVTMVKNDDPIPKDVVKAAANVSGEVVTYNQSFRALKADKEKNFVTVMDSYNLIIPYLEQFKALNEGAEVHYVVNDGRIESFFLCPNFMNVSLQYVRPVLSLDATHLKSKHKGTLYLATVKTGLNDIYTIAIGIDRANEGYDGWYKFLYPLRNACPILSKIHPKELHQDHGYYTFVSDRDKGLIQALTDIFPINHSTQCCIHIRRNVITRFRNGRLGEHIYDIAKTFSSYQEHKMLETIRRQAPPAYEYLVGIAANKWRSTEWLRNKTLPPRYGIVSTNSSESSNSMYEDARRQPWLYCVDMILNSMSSRIALLREAHANDSGVVPKCAQIMEVRWRNCAPLRVFELEPGVDRYKVSRPEKNAFQTNHVVEIGKKRCSCGIWQEFGIPCIDAMAYFRIRANKTLQEIMDSDAVDDFHKYPFYHELLRRNINPVIMDTLITDRDETVLPPLVVLKQPGRPQTKRLRSRSKCSDPEHSSIICSICKEKGHNKRTCMARKKTTTTNEATSEATSDTLSLEETLDVNQLPKPDDTE